MPLTGFSIETLAGLAIAAAFAVLCHRNMPRAILVFAATAWIPYLHIVSLSGSSITQGLLLVEVLASVLIAVWFLDRLLLVPRRPVVATSFNLPLLLLLVTSVVSFLVSLAGVDPAVPAEHVKPAVSVGQVLLIAWPVGLYFVVANTLTSTRQLQWLVGLVIVMAVPSLALPVMPDRLNTVFGGSIYFALAVSPLCFALSFDVRSPLRKLGLWAIAAMPLVYGLSIGKAFLYVTVVTGLAVVAFLRVRRLLGALVPLGLGAYLIMATLSGSFVPAPASQLLDIERRQQSWGGRAGRIALAVDTVTIWSRDPVFGVGPGNSWPYMHTYSVIDTPHNQYLNILLELGIAGLACLVWFIVAALKTGVDLLRRPLLPFERSLVIGWLGIFSGMVVSGLTGDFILHSIRNGGLEMFTGYYHEWLLLGAIGSLVGIARNRR